MKSALANGLKAVSGTAGELIEVHAYRNMVEKYGEDNANRLVSDELKKAGETVPSMQNYLRFKKKVQNGEISFIRAEETAKAEAKALIGTLLE